MHDPAGPEDEPITEALSLLASEAPNADARLLALVYDRLKGLARRRLAALPPGQTIQPTALVHEAWMRLRTVEPKAWDNRRHFFSAAARAMHDIVVEVARRKARAKRGGGRARAELNTEVCVADDPSPVDVLALSDALGTLERSHPRPAQIVMLRYFAGLPIDEIAPILEVSTRTVDREWLFARTYLRRALGTAR